MKPVKPSTSTSGVTSEVGVKNTVLPVTGQKVGGFVTLGDQKKTKLKRYTGKKELPSLFT